jgi:hypothetical protein
MYHRVYILTALALAAASWAAGGCGWPVMRPKKPVLYAVTGRIVDAATGQGIAGARLLLRAEIPTDRGPRTLSAYAAAGVDGTYRVELAEGYAVVRYATSIRLEVASRGTSGAIVDIPPPTSKEKAYRLPDLALHPSAEALLR